MCAASTSCEGVFLICSGPNALSDKKTRRCCGYASWVRGVPPQCASCPALKRNEQAVNVTCLDSCAADALVEVPLEPEILESLYTLCALCLPRMFVRCSARLHKSLRAFSLYTVWSAISTYVLILADPIGQTSRILPIWEIPQECGLFMLLRGLSFA